MLVLSFGEAAGQHFFSGTREDFHRVRRHHPRLNQGRLPSCQTHSTTSTRSTRYPPRPSVSGGRKSASSRNFHFKKGQLLNSSTRLQLDGFKHTVTSAGSLAILAETKARTSETSATASAFIAVCTEVPKVSGPGTRVRNDRQQHRQAVDLEIEEKSLRAAPVSQRMESHDRPRPSPQGFSPTASDPCVYTKGSGHAYVMLTLFVDGTLLPGPSNKVLQEARRDLQNSFAMTDLGRATQILGIDIKQDLTNGTISLSRERYTLSVLQRFKVDTCNPVHTPGTGAELKPSAEGRAVLSEADKKEYQSLVWSLIFLVNCTRFDVAFATMQAARSMSQPSQLDWANAKRILRYLKNTPGMELVYKRDSAFQLTCHSDASYATTAL